MGPLLETTQALIDRSGVLLVFASVIVFELPRYLFATVALALDGLRRHRAASVAPATGTVSIVIPTLNDAGNILRTVRHARASDPPPLEIIVIDDGSTDGTAALLEQARQDGLVDRVITHATRAGKSAACNHGARFASGDFILFLDSDAAIQPGAVRGLLAAFDSDAIAAASGNLAPRNKDESLTTSVQAIEYLVSVTGGRSFLEAFGANACCSGAFVMFRAATFAAAGGYDVGSGEDLEITLRLRRLGYGVKFVPSVLALIEVPRSLPRLLAQRARWDRDALAIRLFGYRQYAFSN